MMKTKFGQVRQLQTTWNASILSQDHIILTSQANRPVVTSASFNFSLAYSTLKVIVLLAFHALGISIVILAVRLDVWIGYGDDGLDDDW